jgi:hypothetical protein
MDLMDARLRCGRNPPGSRALGIPATLTARGIALNVLSSEQGGGVNFFSKKARPGVAARGKIGTKRKVRRIGAHCVGSRTRFRAFPSHRTRGTERGTVGADFWYAGCGERALNGHCRVTAIPGNARTFSGFRRFGLS